MNSKSSNQHASPNISSNDTCTCINTISIMQDRYNDIDMLNARLIVENDRLWRIVDKLNSDNRALIDIVKKLT